MADKKTLDYFLQLFGFNINKKAQDVKDKVQFLNKSVAKPDSFEIVNNSTIQRLFNYWLQNCHDSLQSWKNRDDLYNDIDTLYYNCSQISKAVEIIVDEIIQADSNNQIIFVECDKNIKEKAEELFNKINLHNLIRPTVHDLVLYGNAFWILNYNDKGVNSVKLISPRLVKNRLEFNPVEIYQELQNEQSTLFKYYSNVDIIQKLIDSILNDTDISPYFDEYLLGFEVADLIVPAWKCLHFRNFTNSDPFKPFGTPLYVHAIAPYRQYDAAMSLQISARGVMFPKEVYKLNLPNVTSPTEKLEQALMFLREFMNVGKNTAKDLPGLGDTIVTIEDLVSYEQYSPNIDLGKIDDIELLKDDIFDATLLPRKLIDPKDSSFGEAGVAFREQFKPFARLIYRFQSIVLQQVTNLLKYHFIYSGEIDDVQNLKFTVSMPYPESQINQDIISSQQSLLSLANDIIEALEDKLLGGEKLPIEIKKSIYHKFLPYDSELVDYWIDTSIKELEKAEKDADSGSEEDEGDWNLESANNTIQNKWLLLEKELGKKKLREMVDNIIFDYTYSFIQDTAFNNKHYISSKYNEVNFDIDRFNKILKEYNKNFILQENDDKFNDNSTIANKFYEYKLTVDTDDKYFKKKKKFKKKEKI